MSPLFDRKARKVPKTHAARRLQDRRAAETSHTEGGKGLQHLRAKSLHGRANRLEVVFFRGVLVDDLSDLAARLVGPVLEVHAVALAHGSRCRVSTVLAYSKGVADSGHGTARASQIAGRGQKGGYLEDGVDDHLPDVHEGRGYAERQLVPPPRLSTVPLMVPHHHYPNQYYTPDRHTSLRVSAGQGPRVSAGCGRTRQMRVTEKIGASVMLPRSPPAITSAHRNAGPRYTPLSPRRYPPRYHANSVPPYANSVPPYLSTYNGAHRNAGP
eukprot:3798117-Rhodomonas_salina.1